jgi:hypothetical protein
LGSQLNGLFNFGAGVREIDLLEDILIEQTICSEFQARLNDEENSDVVESNNGGKYGVHLHRYYIIPRIRFTGGLQCTLQRA